MNCSTLVSQRSFQRDTAIRDLTMFSLVRECRADMAKLEIDKEDVHEKGIQWRRNVNVMKRKSNHIRKQTINR